MRITHLYHEIVFAVLRRKIKKDPYIGEEAGDGTYLYTKGIYSINYRIAKLTDGRVSIEWVSHKRRLRPYEEKIKRTKKGFFDFWIYQKWAVFLRPSILLVLAVSIFLFYSELIETQETKALRLKWVIASVVGINPKDIQYIGAGQLEITGQRKRRVDAISGQTGYAYEPVKYAFNPLSWLFSSEGIIKRWRSEAGGGYATHPVVYNDSGDVWLKKQDTWEHGKISDSNIKWDTPQVTGMSIRKTPGHEISVEDKKLKIIDK